MNCAIYNFNRNDFSDISRVTEVIYPYDKFSLEEKLKMTEENSELFYVFDIRSIENVELEELKDLSLLRKNVKFMTDFRRDLINTDLPFFYSFNAIYVDNLDKLKGICKRGVTDAYVTGMLGFQMKNAKDLADRYGVRIRMIPNIAQRSEFTFDNTREYSNVTAFWVRPEDLELYSNYVDTIEFMSMDEKQAVYYDIYMNDRKWRGNLGILIAGLGDIDNRTIPLTDFTLPRLNCEKKCILGLCHKCKKYKFLSKMMVDHNIEIDIED